jgi:hypothetical protein
MGVGLFTKELTVSFINLNYGLMCFEDQNVNSPTMRTLDITRSMLGVNVTDENTVRVNDLAPGESRTVASTERMTAMDGTTSLEFWQPDTTDGVTTRLSWAGSMGTRPGFRTARAVTLTAATAATITRTNAATMRVQLSGASMASVLVGDFLRIEKSNSNFLSAFSPVNQDTFRVLSVGADYVDVLDNGVMTPEVVTLGASFARQLFVMSAAGVQIGDTLEVSQSSGQNINNVGQYKVLDVSPDYVVFQNPYAVSMVFANSGIKFYDRLIGFVYVRASGEVGLKINGGSVVKLAPFGANEATFIGSAEAYKVELVNEGTMPVSASVMTASLC